MGSWAAEFVASSTQPEDGQWITYRIDYKAPHIPWNSSKVHKAEDVCNDDHCFADFEFPDEWGCVDAHIWSQLNFPCTEAEGCEPALWSAAPSATMTVGVCPDPPLDPVVVPEPPVHVAMATSLLAVLIVSLLRKT